MLGGIVDLGARAGGVPTFGKQLGELPGGPSSSEAPEDVGEILSDGHAASTRGLDYGVGGGPASGAGGGAVGRKAWLFVGSDDHAEAAGHLFSMIASARLHGLDPENYLRDVFRALAHWPKDRYLELAPKYWAATRARLDPNELARELGPLTVPEGVAEVDPPPPA